MWLPRPRQLGWAWRAAGSRGTRGPPSPLFRASAAGASSSQITSQRPGAQATAPEAGAAAGARVSGVGGAGWACAEGGPVRCPRPPSSPPLTAARSLLGSEWRRALRPRLERLRSGEVWGAAPRSPVLESPRPCHPWGDAAGRPGSPILPEADAQKHLGACLEQRLPDFWAPFSLP